MAKRIGRWTLIAHLGGGTDTEVSLATDAAAEPQTLVVVKRLKLGTDAEPAIAERFGEEARLCMRLSHPNIVKALEVGEDADGHHLVLEHLDGQTLARIRSRARRGEGSVPRAVALQIVSSVAGALAYAHDTKDEDGHRLRVIHRDVSPENIVVTYDGVTKLIDFSLALDGRTKSRSEATRGNIAYMAPEQSKAAVAIDARADVFALGLVLWELLAGRKMWDGMSEADVIARLSDDEQLPTLRSVAPDVPVALAAICTQALSKVRDDRFESAAEMRDAIEAAVKELDLRATAEEVSTFVKSLFEEDREKMRAMVEEALAPSPDSSRELPRLAPPPASTATPSTATPNVYPESDPKVSIAGPPPPPSSSAAAVDAPAPPEQIIEIVTVEPPPRTSDRRFAIAVAGAALAAVGVVAVLAATGRLTTEAAPEAPRVTTPAVRPGPSVSAQPSAYVEPEEVAIEISARPPTAAIFIDGVKTPKNPHRVRVVKGKFVHDVRVEADGYEAKSMKVIFDRDRSMDVALTPKPPANVAPLRKPPPPPPPPPTASARPAEPPKDDPAERP